MIGYSAYGLAIQSDLPLPELLPSDTDHGEGKLKIVEKPLVTEDRQDRRLQYLPYGTERVLIHWPGLGLLEANGGTELAYAACESEEHALTWRLFLACQGLGVILQQRGSLVLHASAVAHGGRVAVFIGTNGMGKSTMAAAAYAAGWMFLSDDVTALAVSDGGPPLVQPAFGRLRIKRGTRESLDFNGPIEGQVIEGTHKILCNVGEQFQKTPLPLGRIYVLTDDPILSLVSPSSVEQFFHLSLHTYGHSLTRYIGKAPLHLQQCSALIRQGFVKVLRRPRKLTAITDVLAAVARDLAA